MGRNTILKFALTTFCFAFIAFWTIAQKKFHLIINLPREVNKSKMEVRLENRKSSEIITSNSRSENQLILSGNYFDLYAVITLHYQPEGLSKNGYTIRFFVQDKTGKVTFHPSTSGDSVLTNYSLENVEDFRQESHQMKSYSANEMQIALDYEQKYEDEIFNGTDTAIQNMYFGVLMKALGQKEVEYIKANPDSYFSFYSFKTNVTGRGGILPPDSMLQVFSMFPDKFRYSDEGNYLHEFIIGRTSFKRNKTPIDFKTKDIHGKEVDVLKFKGKKYVMIHFWATWCSPCIKELPAIKQINDLYQSKGLEIISVSVESNHKLYQQTIKKYHMVWTQIYNDLDLYNKFGYSPTPRIYLIDKNWNVVYDNFGLGEDNDAELSALNNILKKAFN